MSLIMYASLTIAIGAVACLVTRWASTAAWTPTTPSSTCRGTAHCASLFCINERTKCNAGDKRKRSFCALPQKLTSHLCYERLADLVDLGKVVSENLLHATLLVCFLLQGVEVLEQ